MQPLPVTEPDSDVPRRSFDTIPTALGCDIEEGFVLCAPQSRQRTPIIRTERTHLNAHTGANIAYLVGVVVADIEN